MNREYKNRRYTREHCWIDFLDQTTIRFGLTPMGYRDIKEVLMVELPDVNDTFKLGQPIGFVEAEKIVVDLLAPIDGKVLEVNQEVLKDPQQLLENDTWLAVIMIYCIEQLDELLTHEQYLICLKGES